MKESNGSQYISNTQLQKMTVKTYNTIFEIIHCQQPHIISPFISITITSHSKEGVCYDTWTSPDGQYRNQIDYILCSQRRRGSIQSAKSRLGADCGSDHELLIAKFRLKLKKVGKTTRPFRYDLNQIPYDNTVEVRNRFKGLDLIDEVPDELWMEVRDIVQEAVIKTFPKKKKCKKQNGCLRKDRGTVKQRSCEKKRNEKQRRKGKI